LAKKRLPFQSPINIRDIYFLCWILFPDENILPVRIDTFTGSGLTMDTFSYHIKGIVTTFEQLAKGKFLLFFIPGAIITIAFLLFQLYTNSLEESMMMSSDNSILDWLAGGLNFGIKKAFGFFGFIIDQVYIFIVLTALAPFNTILAERLDTELTGTEFKSTFVRFMNDILRMAFVVIIALFLELIFLSGYWIVSWIVGGEVIDAVMYFVISSFFFGFAFYDFALERDKVGVFGTIGFAFSNPLSMLITGAIFLAIYNIPIIGIPLSPVITVMISTVAYLYIKKKLPKKEPSKIETDD